LGGLAAGNPKSERSRKRDRTELADDVERSEAILSKSSRPRWAPHHASGNISVNLNSGV